MTNNWNIKAAEKHDIDLYCYYKRRDYGYYKMSDIERDTYYKIYRITTHYIGLTTLGSYGGCRTKDFYKRFIKVDESLINENIKRKLDFSAKSMKEY